jgi:TM2 domain-containing membrane protein YozV
MNPQQMFMMLPGLQPDELLHIQSLSKDMNEDQQRQFYMFYQGKRKEQQTMLILTVIGFFGVAGIQRFVTGEIGMGILYLLTAGLCGIGTIVDLINIKKMTAEFNYRQALEAVTMVKMMNPN